MNKPYNRRKFLRDAGTSVLGLSVLGSFRVEAAPQFDLVLKGGTILDGTGGPAWKADIGLRGNSIAAVGEIALGQARRVVDVAGLHVAPGFIDIHSHSDRSIVTYPGAESRVLQGITTEITGNCGGSAAPRSVRPDDEPERERPAWTDVASYFEVLEKTGISVNHALLLGHGTLRLNAIGMVDRRLTKDELQGMLRAVADGMDHGAIGLSTGLEYTPGRYSPTEEIVALAQVVARRGGLYASHIRNEEATLLEAVNEAIAIGRRTGVRVEVSHLKAAGQPNWGKQDAAIHMIESARRGGVDVLADAYPYTAYSTGVSIFLEPWAREGGGKAIAKRLRDPETRARIRREVIPRVASDPGDYDLIVIASLRTEKNRWTIGKNFVEIGDEWNLEPIDALLRLLEEEDGRISFVGHGMSPANVAKVLAHPLVMIGSDGSSMAPVGDAARTRPHPRSYGTYPRLLGHYVRDEKVLDLPAAIRKMTSMPADHAGLRNRGRIARGQKADLVVFDADTVREVSSFADPHRYPVGIRHVLVNGTPVVEEGKHTGERPGQVLRGS